MARASSLLPMVVAIALAGCASQPITGFPAAQPQAQLQPAAGTCSITRQAGTFELKALLAPNGPPVAAKFTFHPAAPGTSLKADTDLGMQYLDNMQAGQTFQGSRQAGVQGTPCASPSYSLQINGKEYFLEASQ